MQLVNRLAIVFIFLFLLFIGLAGYVFLERRSQSRDICEFPAKKEFVRICGNSPIEYEIRKKLFDDYVKAGGDRCSVVRAALMDPVWQWYPPIFNKGEMLSGPIFTAAMARDYEKNPHLRDLKNIPILRYLADYNLSRLEKPYVVDIKAQHASAKMVLDCIVVLAEYRDKGSEALFARAYALHIPEIQFWAAHGLVWVYSDRANREELIKGMQSYIQSSGSQYDNVRACIDILYDTAYFDKDKSVFLKQFILFNYGNINGDLVKLEALKYMLGMGIDLPYYKTHPSADDYEFVLLQTLPIFNKYSWDQRSYEIFVTIAKNENAPSKFRLQVVTAMLKKSLSNIEHAKNNGGNVVSAENWALHDMKFAGPVITNILAKEGYSPDMENTLFALQDEVDPKIAFPVLSTWCTKNTHKSSRLCGEVVQEMRIRAKNNALAK